MDTALGYLYGNIITNLVDNVATLKTVDIDMGQLKSGGENLPFELPAAILKLENVVWERFDGSKRLGTVHVRLKIIFQYLRDDENYTAPHFVRTEVMEFYELIANVRETIRQISAPYHTRLYLINESHLKSNPEDMKWAYCMDWQCNIFSDNSDCPDTGDITIDYNMLANTNEFMERSDLSVVRIGEK